MQRRIRLVDRVHPSHARGHQPPKSLNSFKFRSHSTFSGTRFQLVARMVSEHKSNRKLNPIRASAVDLQHLRYAVAAADHGSFRRAAEVLLLQQSTLSRCISQLEHSLGMTVFERSSGGARATTAGLNFLRTARSIVEQMDSLVNSTYHVGRGEAGRLSVGFYTSISAGNLLATLVDFKRRFVQIDVCLKESSRARLVTALRNGALDIAIATSELPLLGNQGRCGASAFCWPCLRDTHWQVKTSSIGPTSAARRCCSVNMIRAGSSRIF